MMGKARSIVVALLLLLTSGCARTKPDTPVAEPKATATRPATPRAPAKPVAPKVAGRGAPPVARSTTAAPPLDLKVLTQRLRETKAIGLFTKITLKNQVDDLLDGFREYYQGGSQLAITDLRRSFDLLLMKVLSLLQDDDQMLASAIVYSREAIWRVLADPKKFATLDA
jgi:hypothetical protein